MAHFSRSARSPTGWISFSGQKWSPSCYRHFPNYCTCASKHCIFLPPLPLGYVMMTCGVLQLSTFCEFQRWNRKWEWIEITQRVPWSTCRLSRPPFLVRILFNLFTSYSPYNMFLQTIIGINGNFVSNFANTRCIYMWPSQKISLVQLLDSLSHSYHGIYPETSYLFRWFSPQLLISCLVFFSTFQSFAQIWHQRNDNCFLI